MKRTTFLLTPLFALFPGLKSKAGSPEIHGPHPDTLPKRPTSDGLPVPQTFDAREWGLSFVEYVKWKPSIATDPETMHAWFANAIMVGHDYKSPELTGSEAVYGFAGWLTCREEKTVMSATDDAAPIAALVGQFIEANGLIDVRDGWEHNLIHPGGECSHQQA